jgi:hypothetical protein
MLFVRNLSQGIDTISSRLLGSSRKLVRPAHALKEFE